MSTLDDDADMRERIEGALSARFDPEVADEARLEKMGGHASLRVYWRVHLPTREPGADWSLDGHTDDKSLVAMVLAPDYEPARSAEGPEDELLETDGLPFVDVQRYLADLDVPVPEIEYVDREVDVLLLEDLGDRTFENVFREIEGARDIAESVRYAELEALYRQVVDLLVDFQRAALRSRKIGSRKIEGEAIERSCICWRRRFDAETLRWELDHYLVWGIQRRPETPSLDSEQTEALGETFDRLVDELLKLDQIVAFRDFQSRNLMYKERPDREGPWVVIDFQDALVAPFVYDLVALLRDSYIELSVGLVSELVDYYLERGREAGLPWCDRPERVRRAFHLQTVQRKLKDAGRFVFLDREKNNPDFLPYYEPSIGYVDHALNQLTGWDELRDQLHRLEPTL